MNNKKPFTQLLGQIALAWRNGHLPKIETKLIQNRVAKLIDAVAILAIRENAPHSRSPEIK